MRRLWAHRWVRIGAAALALFLVVGAVRVGFIVHGVYSPELDQIPAEADAIVVFAGEEQRYDIAFYLAQHGVAPIIVASMGEDVEGVDRLCERDGAYEVWCVEPSQVNTRGEARMFGEIAEREGWDTIVAVTGNYHVERARAYLGRCFGGDVAFAAVPWKRLNARVVTHETLGTIQAYYLSRGC